MQLSWTKKSWNKPIGYWIADVWESDIDVNNNTSVVNVSFYIKRPDVGNYSETYNKTNNTNAYIYINGSVANSVSPAKFDLRYGCGTNTARGGTISLLTASKRITHNSDGNKSVSIKCTHYCGNTTPATVVLESTFTLTKINKPASPPPPPPPPPPAPIYNELIFESLYSVGSLEVGGSLIFKWEAITTLGISYLSYKVTGAFSMSGSANNLLGTGGNIPAGVIPRSGTVTLTVTLTDYGGRSVSKSITLTIPENYQLYIQDLWIQNTTYIENGKYTAGKTSMHVYYKAVSTFDIKRVDFQMWGSNSNSGGWDWPGKSSTWDSGIVWGVGELGIRCTVTDSAGHTASKEIYATVHQEEHRLNITSFEQTNGNIYILKNHTIGNSRFKLVVKWDNTHTITNVSFNVTGANPMSHSKNNPGGKSYTWLTDNVYNVGDNKIKVTITDSKGAVKTSTINVRTSEEAYTMNVDSSYVDSSLCVNLVKGLAYMDYSRLGVRIKVNHTHALKTVKVTINGRENTLKNIDQYASEFTFIDSDKIEKTGDVTIKFYAIDANGREDSHSITYKTYKIIEPPKKPTISYETKPGLFLSEGEKLVFTGESTDISNYQVIYALESCDVVNATSFCNEYTDSYLHNNGTLTTNLKNNLSGTVRYHILKDFGIGKDASIITHDSNDSKKFHIHPQEPDHVNSKFYALQFFNNAKPGDLLYIYIRERKMGTFDEYLYSDNYAYNAVPKNQLFSMCVLPPSPCQLNIYKKEQTSDKIIIRYANPLYNSTVASNTINTIDVCLIARDQTGNLLDKNGNKSKSENRKRDGLNGKTWIYYSDRQWHNVVPKGTTKHNDKKEFEMSFDIFKYPKGTCFNIVAFYYPDYYNHPSIYSTSNIININKLNINMNLQIQQPYDGTTSTTANPKFKVRVNKGTVGGYEFASIYENYNMAINFNKILWHTNPIWLRSPRTQDVQLPNFTKGTYYDVNSPYKDKLTEPKHSLEIYNKNQDIYRTANLFRIAGVSINDEGSYKENALFIRSNDNNQVYLGDIETSTLLEQGYIDFTWQQQAGRFLSIGSNKIQVFSTPYLYDNELIDYEEHQSYWISDTTLYSMPIMPYNPFSRSIIKPADKSWADVEGEILTIKIPYKLFKPNKEYAFNFSYFVDEGFFYKETGTVYSSDIKDLCSSYMYVNVSGSDLKSLNYKANNKIYSPGYKLISDTTTTVAEENNYNKWLKHTTTFTTPNEEKLIELDLENAYITIKINVRGTSIFKMKDITLLSTDKSHNIDTNKGTLDVNVRENTKSITVLYQGSINIDFGYINPLNYKDMIDLRDYLKAIAIIYGVEVKPKWRTLVKDQSFLMACDYNDTRQHCIDLFKAIAKKYPYMYNGDVKALERLPIITPNTCRGPNTFSTRGKHYFPEWDDLIDALHIQIKLLTNINS